MGKVYIMAWLNDICFITLQQYQLYGWLCNGFWWCNNSFFITNIKLININMVNFATNDKWIYIGIYILKLPYIRWLKCTIT